MAAPILRFLADESCDFAVVRVLRADGHDVVAVSEVTQRSVDSDLIEQSARESPQSHRVLNVQRYPQFTRCRSADAVRKFKKIGALREKSITRLRGLTNRPVRAEQMIGIFF